MIKLDGSFGEGGGQILRTALGLSALTNQGFEINNIRKGRCTPGLKAQHLYSVKALQKLSDAVVIGAKEGSENLSFKPGEFTPRDIKIDIGTAGSTTLVLQAMLPPVLFAKKRMNIKLTGGTDVDWSMPVDYFRHVLVPHLRKYAHLEFNIHRRGYFPKGNGLVEFDVRPKFTVETLKDAPKINNTSRDTLIMIRGVSHASKELEDKKVAERQAECAQSMLKHLKVPIDIQQEYHYTQCPGSGLSLFAYFGKDGEMDQDNPQILGSDSLGKPSKSSEEVAQEATQMLLKEIEKDAPIDNYLADNLIPFLALTGDEYKVTQVTEHAKTNIYAVEQFLGKCLEIDAEKSVIRRVAEPRFTQA